jgi:hypothetical protein
MTSLRERLLTADLVAEFTRAYEEEVNRSVAASIIERAGAASSLAAIERKIEGYRGCERGWALSALDEGAAGRA